MDKYSINVKGVDYSITPKWTEDDYKGYIHLYLKRGEEMLGSAMLSAVDTDGLYVNRLKASNMVNKFGEPILYSGGSRKKDRVPVGTILFDAIRRFASCNHRTKIN